MVSAFGTGAVCIWIKNGRRNDMFTILVCDDEKDIVSALKIYLMADGYQVFEAYNGGDEDT